MLKLRVWRNKNKGRVAYSDMYHFYPHAFVWSPISLKESLCFLPVNFEIFLLESTSKLIFRGDFLKKKIINVYKIIF